MKYRYNRGQTRDYPCGFSYNFYEFIAVAKCLNDCRLGEIKMLSMTECYRLNNNTSIPGARIYFNRF